MASVLEEEISPVLAKRLNLEDCPVPPLLAAFSAKAFPDFLEVRPEMGVGKPQRTRSRIEAMATLNNHS